MSATLRIEDLRVGRRGGHGPDLLRGVDLELRSGETLALVGESGSGKSLTGLALLGLLDEGLELRGGRIGLAGRDLACWCEPGSSCHADVLIGIANEDERD